MEKAWDPQQGERYWYEFWESQGYFSPSGSGEPWCIMIPPPNVTGTLHMGHAFQDTLMDAFTRWQRMQGRRSLWQPGTDHAGIATQMVVERQLDAQGLSRHDLGREAFIERIWRWKEHSGSTITRQLRRMGASVDWEHERFTMDEGLSAAVRETFVRLYDEGLVYRGKRLVNWDPVLRTAVSDLEVIAQEEEGFLWRIRYPLEEGEGFMEVATTRPETVPGDVAVAVHPEDGRYRHLVGKNLIVPIGGRIVPIVADEMVDPAFGTGCVKITPAHDFNDWQVGARHALEGINIFTPDARLNDEVPEAYRGLDRFEARSKIIEDLQARGLVAHSEKHRMMVPRGDRSQAVIEPYLTDQWFVKTAPLAEPAIRAVEEGRIRFVPDHWDKTYFEWMRNIDDWCISRQIWWGHRIPAWYDPEGNIYVGRSEEELRRRLSLPDSLPLVQDEDVLDTWYSSALWPFSTLGWPDSTERLATFYPTTVLITGFDIIFFWVARMIMFGLKFMDDVPFHEVYIHGLVRDGDGNKMSKSKGNILDPIDLIDGIELDDLIAKRTTGLMQPQLAPQITRTTRRQFPDGIPAYGTDALRFTFCSLATQGRDIRFDLGRIQGYRNFCNKMWNAARFVQMQSDQAASESSPDEGGVEERWIFGILRRTEGRMRTAFERYRLDLAAQAIYDCIWNEFCDWYLEFAKARLADPDTPAQRRRAILDTLARSLEIQLRLAHPLIPFITEAIWQRIAPLARKSGRTLMLQPWPSPSDEPAIEKEDGEAIAHVDWIKDLILAIRNIRGELDIAPGQKIPVILRNAKALERERIAGGESCVRTLARIESIRFDDEGTPTPAGANTATALLGGMEILVPLEGLVNKEIEIERLDRQIEKLSRSLERSTAKLANASFLDRAPAEVVAKERSRVSEIEASLDSLKTKRDALAK
ncbi:valine--tRNA ligase [Thioalkalivibrio sp. HK1]|uniref:valine--tRNA ligase n=1 Tax=Thioalkalivibrio sp. HK1 TaxID=1469245 RepID=UPI0004725A88|nr:valine--tRNA ligase [Thioalkalivibrio sp. HK1]